MPYPVNCEQFEDLAVLCALGELEPAARAAAEEHARACPACAAVLQREVTLARILAANRSAAEDPEPSDLLLARCRSRLSRALDAAAPARRRTWTTLFSLRDWIAAFRFSPHIHPAWTMTALLLIAALAGLAGWQGIGRAPLDHFGPAAMTVLAAPPPSPAAPATEETSPASAPTLVTQQQLPADQVAEDSRVYSASDAAMNPILPPDSRLSGAVQNELQGRQPARALRPDDSMLPFWRNAPPPRLPSGPSVWELPERGRLNHLSRKMEALWWGGVRVDPAEQQKRLVRAPAPEYPEVARRAGIEGQVTLLLRVDENGAVKETELISGDPVLGRAATRAVEQWRYAPLRVGGQPVSTLTAVTFDFRLR